MTNEKAPRNGSVPQQAFSIAQFCRDHGISRGMYYLLRKRQLAPATMKLGRRSLISAESAARWRAAMERTGTSSGGKAPAQT